MSVDENKAIIRRWVEARNTGDLETAVALWSDEQQEHIRAAFTSISKAFPDVHIAAKEWVAEGDKVILWWAFCGTHLGTFRDIPATGKTVNWTGIDLYTVADGKIASLVRGADSQSLLRQLGVTVVWNSAHHPQAGHSC